MKTQFSLQFINHASLLFSYQIISAKHRSLRLFVNSALIIILTSVTHVIIN